jgi:putative toxin-antitoxin system antitoxin component (TIGR02293 family)
MASPERRALDILGGPSLLATGRKVAARRVAVRTGERAGDPPAAGRRSAPAGPGHAHAAEVPHLEPGELGWTVLIRAGLPPSSTLKLADALGLSVSELAARLRLPGRTVHRRLAKGETLTPEESERNVRAARVLAKAEDLLGGENGREWVLSPVRGLGGEVPIRLLDTADGFTAVMDELGRLEYGVLG